MKSKLNRKDVFKLIMMAIAFIVASAIFSDWDHFKAGFFGELSNF